MHGTSPTIRIKTLGGLQCSENGRALNIVRLKERALVGFLAVNAGRMFQRDSIINLLWQGGEVAKGRHSLSQAVYTINRYTRSIEPSPP
jgi:DNA-binding SARP family transcriptional activator